MSDARTSTARLTIRRPTRAFWDLGLGELWEHRGLVGVLAWRDIKVRYRRTTIGVGWAVLQPLIATLISTFAFGRLMRVPTDGVPYALFVFTGLLPWGFFATAMNGASTSMAKSERLVSKVYFPRLVIPLSAIVAALPDLACGFLVLGGLMLAYGVPPGPGFLFLPLALLLSFATALGASLWLSALDVEFRDVRYVIGFLQQIWLFATPVFYPSSLIASDTGRALYGLNPMAGVVETFRWALLGGRAPDGRLIALSTAAVLVVGLFGVAYFRRVERTAADKL